MPALRAGKLDKRWQEVCRIRHAVEVCKPLLDAVAKSYGIKRKRKVIIKSSR